MSSRLASGEKSGKDILFFFFKYLFICLHQIIFNIFLKIN